MSEPKKYFGTHMLIFVGLMLYYIFTASRAPGGLVVLSVILHLTTIGVMIVLAYTDPGMVPKVLVQYEKK